MPASFVIRGIVPPILTPFRDDADQIDEDALGRHAAWLVEKGVHGLMPCGTTSEGPLLSTCERMRVIEIVLEAVAGRVPVIPHIGALAARDTVELACHAAERGVPAVSAVTPYFYQLPDSALVEHYRHLAEAIPGMPIFLYNIPQNTGNALSRPVVERILALCPNVVGIKDSAGELASLAGLVSLNSGRFQVVCGSDRLVLAALQAGARASISGNANVFPEVVVGLFRAFEQGDLDLARRQQALLDEVRDALGDGSSLSLLKRALEFRGLKGGRVRPPLPEATPETVMAAAEKLRRAGLLC